MQVGDVESDPTERDVDECGERGEEGVVSKSMARGLLGPLSTTRLADRKIVMQRLRGVLLDKSSLMLSAPPTTCHDLSLLPTLTSVSPNCSPARAAAPFSSIATMRPLPSRARRAGSVGDTWSCTTISRKVPCGKSRSPAHDGR